MIRAIVFDFGQTLVDSADGFRTAEKETQRKACAALGPADGEEFLTVYREIRSRFHARSDFSRKRILEAVFRHYGREPDTALLERWETEYWERIKAMTRIFPEAEAVLTALRDRYRLALITNAQGQTEEGKHRLGNYPELKRFFEVIVVAGEGGVPAETGSAALSPLPRSIGDRAGRGGLCGGRLADRHLRLGGRGDASRLAPAPLPAAELAAGGDRGARHRLPGAAARRRTAGSGRGKMMEIHLGMDTDVGDA